MKCFHLKQHIASRLVLDVPFHSLYNEIFIAEIYKKNILGCFSNHLLSPFLIFLVYVKVCHSVFIWYLIVHLIIDV